MEQQKAKVTRENLFDSPRYVIVHIDGREYQGEVCKPKSPDGYPVIVWLTTDGFDRREFTEEAVIYAINEKSWMYA